jgi:ketosteroid isomerase-like protein
MFRRLAALFALLLGLTGPALANPAEIRDLYLRFVAAQNARDLVAVRALYAKSEDFLWVSDGQTFWGADVMLERMASFQRAKVWRVEPELDRSRVVELSDTTAYMHLPLVLVIGSEAAPDKFRFLVSMLCTKTPEGWRIAALFTANSKEQQ